MVTSKELREDSVISLILRFSGPAIAGMLMMSIYNIVDRIFIGHGVGSLGIAGLTVGFPLMLIKGALGMLIGLGGAALISIRMGQGNKKEAEKILGNALLLMVIIGLSTSVVALIFLNPLMQMFGASESTLPYAISYMRIILIGNVFQLLSLGANNFIRAEGNPKTSMFTNLIGGGVNIILDAIFIMGLQMGVTGAALATIISQFISASWVIAYFFSGKSVLKVRLSMNLSRSLAIISLGAPACLRTLVDSLIIIILNNSLLAYGGDVAVSAMGVIFSIHSLLMMPLMGLSNGAQPIIGFNYGARQFKRVKQALFYGIGLATGFVLIVYIALMASPAFFFRLFTTEADLIAVGSHGLRLFVLMIPVMGFQIVGANYFQATGRSLQSILLNLSRQVLFLIPALLILPRYFNLDGVWAAQPASDVLVFIVTSAFVWVEVKSLGNKANDTILAKAS